MSFLLRLFGCLVLLPSLAHAATHALETPGNGTKVSGLGVVSGWKCEAEGDLTVSFLNDQGSVVRFPDYPGWEDGLIPVAYGASRPDVLKHGSCDSADVGFVAIWNWSNLSDGEYTAVLYDNSEEFARSTVTVTTLGTRDTRGASKRVTVEDFPMSGDTTVLEWNQATQHFEIVDFMGREPIGPIDLGTCVEGLTLAPGEMCTGSLLSINFTVSVNEAGEVCIQTGLPALDGCYPDVASLPADIVNAGIEATKNADGSWTIDTLPAG